MLQRMERVRIIGPKKDFNAAVDALYRAGTVHLEDVSECVSPDEIGLQKIEAEHLREVPDILVKINGIFYTLPFRRDDQELQAGFEKELRSMDHAGVIARAGEIISQLEWTTKDLAMKKSDLEFTIASLNRYEKAIKRIRHVEPELPQLAGYEVNILIIGKEYRNVLELIKKELLEITKDQFEFIHTEIDEESIAAIAVYGKKHSDRVHAFVFSVNMNEVRLPQDYYGMSFDEMLLMIESRRNQAHDSIALINKELEGLSSRWYHELFVLKGILDDINEEISTIGKFGQSEYAFVIQGWVPAKRLKHTEEALKERFGTRVVMEALETTDKDMESAPTFYDNPKFVKPFEFFMNLVRPPMYAEVDPSPLLAIFFPIFFGIMVGDVGYGIIIMALSLIVITFIKKAGWLREVANIMFISSLPTIAFGLLFGEFFGDFGEQMGWLHPVHFVITWNRMEAIVPMLIFVIAIGVFHVFLGLGIGMINALRLKSKRHLVEKIGTMTVLTGLIVLLGGISGILPAIFAWAGMAMVLVSIPMVFYGGGVLGTIELISAVGNILSYARLMAIGMASVVLAMVANKLGGTPGIAVIGISFAVLLHSLNVLLGMFSPSIHALRLHIVEFFSKFYKGGGTLYKPFKSPIKPV